MEKEKNGYWSGLLSGLLLAVLLFGCTYVGRQIFGIYEAKQIANGKEQSELLSNYTTTKIEVIEDTIEKYYLSGTDLATLEDGLYSGMVDALGDPYSVYYSAQELEEIQQKTEGICYGI